MSSSKLAESVAEDWDGMAKVYQSLTLEVGKKPIHEMLSRADTMLPFSEAAGILDNGCGPGPIMKQVLDEYKVPETSALTCTDFSQAMIKAVQEHQEAKVKEGDANWERVETIVQDATNLKDFESGKYSHVLSGWCYFMTSSPENCLLESKRVLKDGGVISCSSWKGSQWLDIMNVLTRMRPDKTMPELPAAWREAAPMKAELEKAGFRDVHACEVETMMTVDKLQTLIDFMVEKMPHMQGLMADMSESEKDQYKSLMMDEGRKLCPSDPGTLVGVSLVAVGRK